MTNMKLSILICTLISRQGMLEKLLSRLHNQIKALGPSGTDEVEIRILEDQKQQSVGKKRNQLLFDALGEFVVFVDDDDDVADDYVFQICDAITKHPDIDCIGFRAIMTVGWETPHQVIYSLKNDAQVEVGGTYYRLPGHLTPIRKAAIGSTRFADKNLGEDADFSSTLYRTKALKKEFFIDKVLYHYQFDPLTSETQPGRIPPSPMGLDRSIFHVVILSNEPDNLRGCLASIFKNEPGLPQDRIIVVDDGSKAECGTEFPKVTWLAGQKPFVYARNANIGIKHAPNDVILLNDDARLETRYGLSSLAYAAKAREEFGLVSAAIHGFVGNPNQQVWARTPEMRREAKNLAFVSVFIPRDTITRVGLLDERFVGYGCLHHEGRVILANGLKRKISDIVRNREKVNVLSMNTVTGEVQAKPVVDWWHGNGPVGQPWIKVSLKRSGRSRFTRQGTVFTPDHRLMTTSGWKEAAKLKPGDTVFIHERRLSKKQLEFIYGSMLGDGSITSRNGNRAYFQVSHSESQWEYMDLKREVLGSCATSGEPGWTPSPISNITGNVSVVQAQKKLHSFNLAELADLRDAIYPKGKKTVSWEWLKEVGPFGLAVFYMDDGFQQKKSARLCCHDMGEAGTKLVAKRLMDFGISCSIDRDSRSTKYKWCDPLFIRMRQGETRLFMKLIGAFVPPSMRYKVTDDAPPFNQFLWNPDESMEAYHDEVVSIKPWIPSKRAPYKRARFCISVEDNENFFTSSGLAHNCEDNDLSLRVKQADLFMATYDGCVVEHNSKENKSTFRTRSNIDTLFEQNKSIFKEKWPQIRME